MSFDSTLSAWNFQVLMLVQTLVGAISPNFRMVALCRGEDQWIVKFYLEEKLKEDIDEIEDIFCQYTAYQDENLKCESEIIVGTQKLPNLSEAGRVVYRRKEGLP